MQAESDQVLSVEGRIARVAALSLRVDEPLAELHCENIPHQAHLEVVSDLVSDQVLIVELLKVVVAI